MKLAFSTLACPDWTWTEAIQAARDYGYDGIEWRLINGETVTSQFPVETCKRIGAAVADAGLGVCALDGSTALAFPPGPDRDRQIEEARGMLRLARAMGTEILRVFPGKYPESVTDTEAMQWVTEGLNSLIPTARETGVKIALEVHDTFDWQRRALRGTTTSSFLAEILPQVDAQHIGIQWDLGNPYFEGERAEQTWGNVRDWLTYVHMKDMRPTTAGDWEYVPMGAGVLPVPAVIDWLSQAEYDGWLSFEWEKKWHPELAEPEISLPQYIAYMHDLLRGSS